MKCIKKNVLNQFKTNITQENQAFIFVVHSLLDFVSYRLFKRIETHEIMWFLT